MPLCEHPEGEAACPNHAPRQRAEPGGPWTIEVCNTCNGVVGWRRIRDGCCLGGVVCRRPDGTRLLTVALDAKQGASER